MRKNLIWIKNITGILGFFFILNVFSTVLYIVVSEEKIPYNWYASTASVLIMNFLLWKLASNIHMAIEDLSYHKQDKTGSDLSDEEELIRNYSDHR